MHHIRAVGGALGALPPGGARCAAALGAALAAAREVGSESAAGASRRRRCRILACWFPESGEGSLGCSRRAWAAIHPVNPVVYGQCGHFRSTSVRAAGPRLSPISQPIRFGIG